MGFPREIMAGIIGEAVLKALEQEDMQIVWKRQGLVEDIKNG